jgi:multicomponent Na+:H+ antiporter subunit G
MNDILVSLLLIVGSIFMFLASLGIVRFPDLFTRMHAATKAPSFSMGCILIAVSIHFADFIVLFQSLIILFFIFLTLPIGAHMIGRAAYLVKTPLWDKNVIDQLKNCYDPKTGTLGCPPEQD